MTVERGEAYSALINELHAVTIGKADEPFNRETVSSLIKVLISHLDKIMGWPEAILEDGTEVLSEHPALRQLRGLSSALEDLDLGLQDPALTRASTHNGAARKWQLREQDDTLLEALLVFERVLKQKNRSKVARELARKLNAAGYRRQGERLTGVSIIGLYQRLRNQ